MAAAEMEMDDRDDRPRPRPKLDRKKLASVRATAIKMGVLAHEVDEGSPCLKCGEHCPGFSLHFWRKICKNCLCGREEHDVRMESVDDDQGVRVGKILFSPTADTLTKRISGEGGFPRSPRPQRSLDSSGGDTPSLLRKSQNLVWTPGGCSVEAARIYFDNLPPNKTPTRGTPGERYRQKQYSRQLPAHDIDILYLNEDLTEEEKKQMELFIRMRQVKVLGKGEVRLRESGNKTPEWACQACHLPMKTGEVGVFAERVGPNKYWHPACFTCTDCNELLVDLIYFYNDKDESIYCGRHHAEKWKPRCSACDELILCTDYTRAEDNDWHLDHFCCLRCDKELGGEQYRPQEGMPFCLPCYDISFATVCETCGNTITVHEPRLSHNNITWHGTPDCFKCSLCGMSLVERAFLPKHGKIFCSKYHAKQYRRQETYKH